jgi:hypothetical protein
MSTHMVRITAAIARITRITGYAEISIDHDCTHHIVYCLIFSIKYFDSATGSTRVTPTHVVLTRFSSPYL